MGKVLFMRKGETHTAPVVFVDTLSENFADNDWETISEACQRNVVPETWAVGDQKAMTINGTSYVIDIIGRNHDDYADGSGKAPLTFQMHDCYGVRHQMNESNINTGGWADSAMRTAHLPSILALMPSEVQARIKEVNKLTSIGSRSGTILTTVDKLFLLSEIETAGKTSYSKSGEGTQYAYYAAGNSKIKLMNGSGYEWWERSPRGDNATSFCSVNMNGGNSYNTAITMCAVAFAFCF